MKDPVPGVLGKDAIVTEWLIQGCRMDSQTGEVALSILDAVVLSSISVIPFYTEPYTVGPIHFPYVSDGPNVARENEPSANGW
jgi:hypothetical protein